jgi:hypothetical protein
MATAWDWSLLTIPLLICTWNSSSPGIYFRPGIYSDTNIFVIVIFITWTFHYTYILMTGEDGSFITGKRNVNTMKMFNLVVKYNENNEPVSWQTCSWNCMCHIWLQNVIFVVHVNEVTLFLNCSHQLNYCSSPTWYLSMENQGGMKLTGKTEELGRKTCPSAILSARNPTRTDSGQNPGLCGERLVTNCLSHGTANFGG